MCGTHWALGASEHPGLSGPDLQMSSPGTARLGRHYHSSRSSNLLTASPYSSSWTFHRKRMQVRTEMNSPCSDVTANGPGCPPLCMWSRSDSSGFLFEGMLTRNQRGSPPAFLIWLHQLTVRRHHVTETAVKTENTKTSLPVVTFRIHSIDSAQDI